MSAEPPPDSPTHAALPGAVFDHALDAILLTDDALRCVDANLAACELLGYARDELCRLSVSDLTPEEDRHLIPGATAAFRTAERFRREWRLRAKDGTVRVVDMNCTGNVLPGLHLSVARDVTARKQAEAEADLLRRALGAIGQGVVVTDRRLAGHPIVYANPAAARVTGYPVGELLGRNCRVLLGPHDDQPGLAEARAALRAGTGCLVELVNRRKDGEDWYNLLGLTPIRDDAGKVTHYVGIQTDVTRLRDHVEDRPVRPAPLPRPGRTVLLVEDEEAVREFVRFVLEQAGYTVVSATDGEHALALFRADPDRFDLVLSDVMMPKRTGPDLAAELRLLRPGVRVVFMSGFTGGTAANPIDLPPGATLLEKPFSLDRLLGAVAAAIGGG